MLVVEPRPSQGTVELAFFASKEGLTQDGSPDQSPLELLKVHRVLAALSLSYNNSLLGFNVSEFTLHTHKHIFAVSSRENCRLNVGLESEHDPLTELNLT